MIYNNLNFPSISTRPFFYTSFVSTIDGKVWVEEKGYWPIGSKIDYETFTFLRANADAIIDGRKSALRFGKDTIQTIHSNSFKTLRKKLGKKEKPQYFILTSHPDTSLYKTLENSYDFKPTIFEKGIRELVRLLKKQHLEYVFIDGGPHLLASLLQAGFLDEIFLTIAPKIFGNRGNTTITMTEGILFPPESIKKFTLVSTKSYKNEVYLRYRKTK